MKTASRRLREQAGYSLVEVVVAILLLSIAIIPMVSMFDAGLRSAVLGGNYDKARATATEQLEGIKALPYEDVVARYSPGSSTSCDTPGVVSSCEVTTAYVSFQGPDNSEIKEDSVARSMMRVKVEVEWDGGDNSYTTTGLIAEGSV